MQPKPPPPTDVDEYISQVPEHLQPRLHEIRATIKAAAPDALERISYGIPYYEYKGRLIYFALYKKHIGLYALSTPVLEQHETDLQGRVTPKGTIHLPLTEDLPLPLITSLVQAQAHHNEQSQTPK